MDPIYACAGIDFIIGRDGKPYFIEANSSPGGMYELFLATGSKEPVERLAEFVMSRVDSPRAVIPIKLKEGEILDPEVRWKIRELSRFFPVKMVVFNRERIDPESFNVVLFNRISFDQEVRNSALKINPVEVIRITADKHLSTLIAKNHGVNVPESFIIFHRSQVERIVKKYEIGEWVLKPNFGGHGRFIKFFSKGEEIPEFRGIHILQEKIDIEKRGGKFWDVRAFVIGGKYAGSIVRVAESPVVNISQGGSFEAPESKIEKLVKREAEITVKAIDKAARAMLS